MVLPARSEAGGRRQDCSYNRCVGKQNQGEPVGFRVDPVCEALHRSYSGMDQHGSVLGRELAHQVRPAGRKRAHLFADRFDSDAALDEGSDAGKLPRR